MMKSQQLPLLLSTCTALLSSPITAHRPLLTRPSCSTDYNSSTSALTIPDPTISWAFLHYTDCSSRVLWTSFVNPSADFQFYVGVGVPPVERYEDVRANALIIGEGLPQLDEEVFANLPEEIRNDPVWNSSDVGAYYHEAPQDQSTCDHLGSVMFEASTVLNGRCDFYEPFGRTHSWRVLDADNNSISVPNATYYVAMFLQEDVSAKFGVALGTWVENFWTQYELDTPGCTRVIDDFSEKDGDQTDCFPMVRCSALGEDEDAGCTIDGEAEVMKEVCELGELCSEPDCIYGGIEYASQGSCGGQLCPAAVNTWGKVNMEMHEHMMDLEYTGDAEIDFVRGMIPHHRAAVRMCSALLNLTCAEFDAIDSLEGLVHLCSHIDYEQEIEVESMLKWLESKSLDEKAPCSMGQSCGKTNVTSSTSFIELNNKMMVFMAVEYSCDHSVDFVRQMIPHHAAAVAMCEVVMESTKDYFLVELCNNITLTQKAEISWMYEWLTERDTAVAAPCDDECDSSNFMTRPCEDLLSTSSFCHELSFGADGYCRCDDTFADDQFSCSNDTYLEGVGVFVPALMCKRTCGLCGVDGSDPNVTSIWPHSCYKPMNQSMQMHGGGASTEMEMEHSEQENSSTESVEMVNHIVENSSGNQSMQMHGGGASTEMEMEHSEQKNTSTESAEMVNHIVENSSGNSIIYVNKLVFGAFITITQLSWLL